MNFLKNKLSYHLLALSCIFVAATQIKAQQIDLSKKIPIDPKVRIGKLENGFTYYIRENKKPENRAELRLMLNAGSLQENDDQQGLAHFVEHMCFNGTKNFEKNELISYLQSVGVTMGPDINGYTSFDETGYILTVPTDSAEILNNGFLIMEDWAHNVSFDREEIDKERGIVVEEWRLGRGAYQRMRDQYLPVLFKGSRYAERLPIGNKETIENASYATITQFYKDWYRPDLMAFAIVGDIDADEMEAKIKEHFGKISAKENPRTRENYDIPDHQETLVSVVSDPENAYTRIILAFKQDHVESTTLSDLKRSLQHEMFTGMARERLNELSQKADPPFIGAYTRYGSMWSRAKDAYQTYATVKEDGIERGLKVIIEENERIKKHGFTQPELERQKKNILSSYENRYKEREKTESRRLVGQYTSHFLTKNPIPGIEFTYQFVQDVLPEITLEEVNALAQQWITPNNRVIVVQGIDKPEITLPTEEEVLAIIASINIDALAPYEEKAIASELMSELPTPGKVISSKRLDEPGIKELTLSNGAKVVLKATDFKEDEIIVQAHSLGGISLYELEDFHTARYASSIVASAGVGEFSKTDLSKVLSGTRVNVYPYIWDSQEGLNGRCTPDDLETLMKLVHLYFTQPRKDQEAFDSFISKQKAMSKNQLASPNTYYFDQVTKINTQDHPRARRIPTEENLATVQIDRALEIYQERFADASDFTFFFVGSFDEATIVPLLERYIASLPSSNSHELCIDRGIRASEDMVIEQVHKGKDPKSIVNLYFEEEVEFNPDEAHVLRALAEYLNLRYFDVLREQMSGVYGVRAIANINKYPWSKAHMRIIIPCGPDNAERLREAALEELKEVQENGVSDDYILKIHQQLLRGKEKGLKENGHWMYNLVEIYRQGDKFDRVTNPEVRAEMISSDALQEIANKYIDLEAYTMVSLYPEDYEVKKETPQKK